MHYRSLLDNPAHHRCTSSPPLVSSSRRTLAARLPHSMKCHSEAPQDSTRWHSEHACFCFALVDSAPYSRTLVTNLRLPFLASSVALFSLSSAYHSHKPFPSNSSCSCFPCQLYSNSQFDPTVINLTAPISSHDLSWCTYCKELPG